VKTIMLTEKQRREGRAWFRRAISANSGTMFLAALVALASLGQAAEPPKSASPAQVVQKSPAERLDEVLHWLPADTETIVVTNSVTIDPPKTLEDEDADELAASDYHKAMELLRNKDLIGHKMLLAVGGSRCFRVPRGSGGMPYQGCEISIVEESAAPALTSAVQSILKTAKTTTEIAGKPVAVFEEKVGKRIWTFFLVQPKPQVFLYATHRGYLQQVLEQIEKPPEARAMPAELPEWKIVDTTAPVWAIRHYSKAAAAKDPTSPLREGRAVANVRDPEAVGLAFSGDPVAKRATAWYLSHSKNLIAITSKNFAAEVLHPKVEQIQPGVARVTFVAETDNLWKAFVLVLRVRLGQGV
jgi:hypothetical protein